MSKLARLYDRSRVPLYIQVASVIRQRIETGYWQPGQKISTLEELEREFEVARVTVRQAIELLREEALLRCQQGRGTFVADEPPNKRWLKLAADWASLIEPIKDNVPKPIKVEAPPAAPELASGEGVLADGYVFLKSVQYRGGDPYSIVALHLASDVFDRARKEFRDHPALPVLASLEEPRIKNAHQTLVISGADPETADLLKVGLGAPTAECRCVVIDEEGRAIYVANIIYRSDCIKLHMNLLGAGASSAVRSCALQSRPNGPTRRALRSSRR
jgi:GntR family transcriptional regulator